MNRAQVQVYEKLLATLPLSAVQSESMRTKIAEMETRHALFPIVQGSMFAGLRRECCEALVERIEESAQAEAADYRAEAQWEDRRAA